MKAIIIPINKAIIDTIIQRRVKVDAIIILINRANTDFVV